MICCSSPLQMNSVQGKVNFMRELNRGALINKTNKLQKLFIQSLFKILLKWLGVEVAMETA